MKKITKKEFIDTLCAHESVMAFRIRRELSDSDKAIVSATRWDNMAKYGLTEPVIRQIAKRQTNAVMFDNESWLYFDQVGDKSYWRLGDTIMQRVSSYDKYNNREWITILAYLINYNS